MSIHCECCGNAHDGTFGSGRFCSRKCSNKRKHSGEVVAKIRESVSDYYRNKKCYSSVREFKYVCALCSSTFVSATKIRSSKLSVCSGCRKYSYICTVCNTSFTVPKRRSRKIKKCDSCRGKDRYQCSQCGIFFINNILHSSRNKLCLNCRRKVVKIKKSPKSIIELSGRTASKVLSRMGIGCSICGWCEASCDIHHIIPTSKGGSDDPSNLVVVCPNHHRVIHNSDVFPIAFLKSKAMSIIHSNWVLHYGDGAVRRRGRKKLVEVTFIPDYTI